LASPFKPVPIFFKPSSVIFEHLQEEIKTLDTFFLKQPCKIEVYAFYKNKLFEANPKTVQSCICNLGTPTKELRNCNWIRRLTKQNRG